MYFKISFLSKSQYVKKQNKTVASESIQKYTVGINQDHMIFWLPLLLSCFCNGHQ